MYCGKTKFQTSKSDWGKQTYKQTSAKVYTFLTKKIGLLHQVTNRSVIFTNKIWHSQDEINSFTLNDSLYFYVKITFNRQLKTPKVEKKILSHSDSSFHIIASHFQWIEVKSEVSLFKTVGTDRLRFKLVLIQSGYAEFVWRSGHQF